MGVSGEVSVLHLRAMSSATGWSLGLSPAEHPGAVWFSGTVPWGALHPVACGSTLVNAFFSSSFPSPASSGNRHLWQSSPDQRERDGFLPLHEQERQASGEGKCFLLINL